MKKQVAMLLVGVLVGVSLAASGPPASATHKGCVTRAEFDQVQKGMTKPDVHEIFGMKGYKYKSGKDAHGHRSQGRFYMRCRNDHTYAAVIFHDDPLMVRRSVWNKKRK